MPGTKPFRMQCSTEDAGGGAACKYAHSSSYVRTAAPDGGGGDALDSSISLATAGGKLLGSAQKCAQN
jgi:hypothetical protein